MPITTITTITTSSSNTTSNTTSSATDRLTHVRPVHDYRVQTTQRRPLVLPWAAIGRFSTAADEARLITDLARRKSVGPADHRRSDVTALVNALRGGLTADLLLAQAPGLRPERLLDAHRELEARRRRAAAAWAAIVATPDAETLAANADCAAALLPTHIARLVRVAQTAPDGLRSEILRSATAVDRARAAVRQVERKLDAGDLDADEEAALARRLYDQHDGCLISHDDHLADRVGTLDPTRVAALLGEQGDRPDENDVS